MESSRDPNQIENAETRYIDMQMNRLSGVEKRIEEAEKHLKKLNAHRS